MDRETWWAIVHKVTKSHTFGSDLACMRTSPLAICISSLGV